MGKRSKRIALKYAMDRMVATVAVTALSPAFVAIAATIRMEDGGPAFFVQERPGLDGVPFGCLKFRTMIVDADRFVDDEGKPTRTRVTRVGKILRWTSLDELPQLLNIAKGEMSIIGPRPPLMIHLRRYNQRQMQRFRMKPGLTGLSQVNGRNRLKWTRRIELDNSYIDHFSLRQDLEILMKTVRVVLLREGVVEDRNPGEVDDLPAPRPVGAPVPEAT